MGLLSSTLCLTCIPCWLRSIMLSG